MMPEREPGRMVRRGINTLAALGTSAAVLALFAFGYGPVPALGRALDPGPGAWASAAGRGPPPPAPARPARHCWPTPAG